MTTSPPFKTGDPVICNDRLGTIETVHTGRLVGMADVRLPSGVVCVSLAPPDVYPGPSVGAVYESGAGNRWRVVGLTDTKVTFERVARRVAGAWEDAEPGQQFTWALKSLTAGDMTRIA